MNKRFDERKDNPGEIRMTLFVTGLTPRSSRAILNIKALCTSELGSRCKLTVVDIYLEPAIAVREQVYAAPMLIKYSPSPERRIIGDLSDMKQVRQSLGLIAA